VAAPEENTALSSRSRLVVLGSCADEQEAERSRPLRAGGPRTVRPLSPHPYSNWE
jgi:hypothetical protein